MSLPFSPDKHPEVAECPDEREEETVVEEEQAFEYLKTRHVVSEGVCVCVRACVCACSHAA